MSKVSVTGARTYMPQVIETVYDLNLVHLSDYDGSWEGFDNGTPIEGSEEASEKLVTVRSLENVLDLDEAEEIPEERIDESTLEARLEDARTDINERDDRLAELRGERREIQDQIDRLVPFADLGIDLDLLSGYDSIDVAVGEGDETELQNALEDADEVRSFETFGGDAVVGLFAAPADGVDDPITDALVGVEFTRLDVPDGDGSPQEEIAELKNRRRQIDSEIESVEAELESLKREYGGFLLGAERYLTIEAERTEAPLQFATSNRAFIAEGWIPTEQYDDLVESLEAAVGDHVEIEELERAAYDEHGAHSTHDDEAEDEVHEATDDAPSAADTDDSEPQRAATDGGQPTSAGASGGAVTMDDEPPVVQQNSKIVNPFEVLVTAVNRPKYSEFDPSVTLFVTFPIFFGFMIGDIGYGITYALIGYWLYRAFDSEALQSLGGVIGWMAIWTVLFGVAYGEIFGLHFFEWFMDDPSLSKGTSDTQWAITWLLVAVIAGILHLNLGYIFEFLEEYQLHGPKPAIVEVGSWLLMLNGIWLFVFSEWVTGPKPEFLVGPDAVLNTGPLGFGFEGFAPELGMFGVVLFVLGIAILLTGPWYEVVEFVVPLSHVLSYTRLTAVLLAKAGMAIAANLIYWGAYRDADGFHFIHAGTPEDKAAAGEDVVFDGLANMGPLAISAGPVDIAIVGALIGLPAFIVAHAIVLAIGGTAAIQAIRLEYFEFFEKFYEGGGKKYEPFGDQRTQTSDKQ